MTDAERDDRAHRDSAALAITVGRLDERLKAIHQSLEHHMKEEHKDFQDALKKVEQLHETVRDLHSAARVTRWIAAIASGVLAVVVWVRDHIRLV